jgi:hypothetical protein
VGDKVSGALMKLKGSLTSKPGLKVWLTGESVFVMIDVNGTQAAGTRRMHGTDGKGARRVY